MTIEEAYIYLGIRIYMGIHQENKIEDHWSLNRYFPNHPANKIMSLMRFQAIHRRIRLAEDPPEGEDFKGVFDRVSSFATVRPCV